MKIRPEGQWLIALFATAAAALASQASGQAPAAPIPAASEILARAAKALDPLGTLSNHSSTHSAATVEVAGMGILGSVESYAARPNRLYTKLALGAALIESGHDGTTGWVISSSTGPALMDSAQLARIRQASAYDYWLHRPEMFRSIGAPEAVRFEGRPSYKIHFVATSGWAYDEYFDVELGYRRGLEYIDASSGANAIVVVILEDLKRFGDALVPATVTQRAGGVTLIQRTTLVEFDAVPDSVFAVPAAIRALRTKAR